MRVILNRLKQVKLPLVDILTFCNAVVFACQVQQQLACWLVKSERRLSTTDVCPLRRRMIVWHQGFLQTPFQGRYNSD